MKILALEFSSEVRSVAFGDISSSDVPILTESSDRSTTGIELVDQTLRQAKAIPEEVDVLAVGLGPGSYGGIRSAIALAQGWQLARGTRLLGISSFVVLLREAEKRGFLGRVAIMIDAQRNEFYHAEFALEKGSSQEIVPLAIVPIQSIPGESRRVGPRVGRLVPGGTNLNPSAATLLELAAGRSDFTPGENLEPIYLRETSFVKAPPARFS